jgi:hypothetical protein
MAVVTKRLGRGIVGTTTTTAYQVPVNATALIKAVTLCNQSASNVTVNMILASSTYVIANHVIKAGDTITIPFLDQVINANETIIFTASAASSVHYYISGKEVT